MNLKSRKKIPFGRRDRERGGLNAVCNVSMIRSSKSKKSENSKGEKRLTKESSTYSAAGRIITEVKFVCTKNMKFVGDRERGGGGGNYKLRQSTNCGWSVRLCVVPPQGKA